MGRTSSRYGCTIGAKNKSVNFFFKFFFVGCGASGVGAWVWGLGCGGVGVGVWVWRCGCGGVGARVGRRGGGMRMGGRGMRQAGLGLSLSDGRESPPWASPSRIRIAGSGVIDRPTFRLPGSQMRACLGWEAPHTPHKMATMPLGCHRSL